MGWGQEIGVGAKRLTVSSVTVILVATLSLTSTPTLTLAPPPDSMSGGSNPNASSSGAWTPPTLAEDWWMGMGEDSTALGGANTGKIRGLVYEALQREQQQQQGRPLPFPSP